MVTQISDTRLLRPGWAGDISDAEATYIAEELRKSSILRRDWGVKGFFGKHWKRISADMVKRLGDGWAQNPVLGIQGTSVASHKKIAGGGDTILSAKGQLTLDFVISADIKDANKIMGGVA